jgi:hypothetical protein
MGIVIRLTGYRPPAPAWVEDLHLLLLHPLPRGFATEMARATGIDESDPAIGYAAALERLFGVGTEDLAWLFVEIGMRFGDAKLCFQGAKRIAGLLDCSSLARALSVARTNWEKDQDLGQTARDTLVKCRCIVAEKYTQAWRPLDEFMKHVVLLIEATRLEHIPSPRTT